MGSRARLLTLLLSACICQPALGGEAAYAARPLELVDHPGAKARVLARLGKRQAVEIVGRNGSWARVIAGQSTGWVRLADLRLNATASSEPPATASKRSSAARGDTGIRGFSEDELVVGAPNHAEGEKLRHIGVAAADATSFARAANLRPRAQDYILMDEYMPADGLPEGFFDE